MNPWTKYEFRTLSARDRFLEWCMKAAPLFESGNGTKSVETDSNLYTDIRNGEFFSNQDGFRPIQRAPISNKNSPTSQ